MTTFVKKWAAGYAREEAPSRVTPRFIARVQQHLADPTYHREAQRQLRRAILGVVIGLVGAAVSLTVLLGGGLEFRVGAFWLVCGLLSLGIFAVAEVAIVGGYLSQLAMQRFAEGQKDCDAYEAVREFEQLHGSMVAFRQLTLLPPVVAAAPAVTLLVDTVDYIADVSSVDPTAESEQKGFRISSAWKALGADDTLLARLAMKG